MKILTAILLSLAIVAVICFLLAWPTQLLWNWLMPVIFGLPEITFWQAMGLMWLSSLLFKSASATTSTKS